MISMSTLLVQPSNTLGDGSLRGIAASNKFDVDYFLFVAYSSQTLNAHSYQINSNGFQLVLPRKNNSYDLSDVLSIFRLENSLQISNIILRNYVEIGNFQITDRFSLSSLHYCVLGDTHHLPNSLTWCFNSLVHLKPQIFFSRSNPTHALLLDQCLRISHCLQIEYCAAPDYLLVQSQNIDTLINKKYPINAALCISNLRVQLGRRRLIKKLLISPLLLELTKFFDFMPENSFRRLLDQSSYLFVPSINGQISPQIFYALDRECSPIVDCGLSLDLSDFHRQLLSIVVSLSNVLGSSSLPSSQPTFNKFRALSSFLKNLAQSEVQFVHSYLSGDPILRQYFSLSSPSNSSSVQLISLSDDPLYKSILSKLDRLKLVHLCQPFLRYKQQLISERTALVDSIRCPNLYRRVTLCLDAMDESRSWLYDYT